MAGQAYIRHPVKVNLYNRYYARNASLSIAVFFVFALSNQMALGQSPIRPSVYFTDYFDSNGMTVFGGPRNQIYLPPTYGIAASPDGQRIYVSSPGIRTIYVIDTLSNLLVDQISLDSPPNALAVSPDGTLLYATTYSNLAVINTATKALVANPAVGLTPLGVAATPDGSKIYVTNYNSDSVSVITTKNFKVKSTISVAVPGSFTAPSPIAISPDGATAYVVLSGASSVAVLDTNRDSIIAMIPVGPGPTSVAFTPDGHRAYVTYGSTVSFIDTASQTVTANLDIGDQIEAVGVSAQGDYVWVTHPFSQQVSVIDTTTNAVTTASTPSTTWSVAINDIRMAVDIQPGMFPNVISLNGSGKVQVAILSRPGFSAPDQIYRAQLTFGHTGHEQSLVSCNAKGDDLNHDGLPDLVCWFDIAQSNLQLGDTVGIVRATIFNGGPVPFVTGVDSVKITAN
jgi:YVTN family beta-propeller protein